MKQKIITLILLGCLLLAGCAGGNNDKEELDKMANQLNTENSEPTAAPEAGETEDSVPEDSGEDASNTDEEEPYILTFEASTIENDAWNSDKLADSRLTMINIWATYCNPCLDEMPDLGELATEYDAVDFQLIGIISDVMEGDSEDTMGYAKELITETTANYPHLLLNESLYMNLVGAVSSVPTTFFVNQDSEVLGYVIGAQSKETWKSIIDQLLAEME